MNKYHINPETGRPNICNPVKTGVCKYATDGENPPHYDSKEEAREEYEKIAAKEYGTVKSLSNKNTKSSYNNKITGMDKITLRSSIGEIEVINGDLSNPDARASFTSGLCGDLALAIHEKTDAEIFFVCSKEYSQEEFDRDMGEDHEYLFDVATHAVVASSQKGKYLDADGQHSLQNIQEFYRKLGQEVHMIKGTPEQVRYYSTKRDPEAYAAFADTAIEMDRNNFSYEKEIREY